MDPDSLRKLAEKVKDTLDVARRIRAVGFGADAAEAWKNVYPVLSDGRPGLLGAVTARAEAQTLRLALVYALLDGSSTIRLGHLEAALAAWKYCEDSARLIFGDKLGDPTADEILQLLRESPNGITRNDITNHFKRNKTSAEISRALTLLQSLGLAHKQSVETGGRDAELWLLGAEKKPTR